MTSLRARSRGTKIPPTSASTSPATTTRSGSATGCTSTSVALGATVEKVLDGKWGPYDEFAIMMRDPEGNEFCLQ